MVADVPNEFDEKNEFDYSMTPTDFSRSLD